MRDLLCVGHSGVQRIFIFLLRLECYNRARLRARTLVSSLQGVQLRVEISTKEDNREAVVNESFNAKPQAPAVSHCSLLAKQPSPAAQG
jgi:hypothetical protein